MKFALIFTAVLAVSAAQFPGFGSQSRLSRPPPPPKPVVSNRVASSDQAAKVLHYENEANPDGSYRYNVQIDNGIAAEAQGTPRDFGGNPPVVPVVSQGSFSWISPEGQLIVITYVADENGYQPSGDAIPTPPTASGIAASITNNTPSNNSNNFDSGTGKSQNQSGLNY